MKKNNLFPKFTNLNTCLIVFFFVNIFSAKAQEDESLKIERFIYNTELLRINEKGVIIPQLDRYLNQQIKNYMSVIFFDVVESVDNIIWQSYQTKTNTIIKSQFINYFVRVQIKSPNQNKEFRYLEMIHYPSTNKIETFYVWNPEKRDFELNDQEIERLSYLPDLKKLLIENQDTKPSIDEIIDEYKDLLKGINNGIIYFNESKEDELKQINRLISDYIIKNYQNIEFIMNISFDSYFTFVGSYDRFHYHTFIVQVKLTNFKFPFFLEIFYNPKTKKVKSDVLWDNDKQDYFRPRSNE
mgnify:FL=1|jgi:hypothetical protein